MKSYLSYFKLKFITGLQYRAAALAGMSTQLFFGFMYISIYIAFYESGSSNLPMHLDELVNYIWITQSFFMLIYAWYKDQEIINMIKTGNIAYELLRPQDLYLMWLHKILGERLSKTILRVLPVALIAIVLPKPYTLSLKTTLPALTISLVALLFAVLLMGVLVTLYHVICMFTLDEKGIIAIIMVAADILSGLVVPIPFFPKYLQNINNFLPFRYISDFPVRLYIGNIPLSEGLIGIIVQIVWIIILFVLGKILANIAIKKAVIQGG